MKDIQNEIGDASLQPYPFTIEEYSSFRLLTIKFYFTTDKDVEYTAIFSEMPSSYKKEYEFAFIANDGEFKDVINKGEVFRVMSTIVKIFKKGVDIINSKDGWKQIYFYPTKSFKGDERRKNLYQSYIIKSLPPNIEVNTGPKKITFINLNPPQRKIMEDIQKIKEFFSKPMEAITTAYEAKGEYFKPSIRKDKSNPNFLYVDIAYPEGSDVLSVGGDKTMGGQDRESGAAKALSIGNNIVKKLQSKYNIEDIKVKDLKNGKVEVFAVSDDFIKMSSPSLEEAKKETAVDMAKKQLDALGVKYEMSGNKFKPFKAIYKPSNEDLDALYDQEYELTRIYQNNKSEENWKKLSQIREKGKRLEKFDEIIYLFNLGSAVKQPMDEAKFQSGMLSGKDFINAKLKNYPKAVAKVNQLIDMIGESKFTIEMAEWLFDFFNNASYESPMNEAKEEDIIDTITMDVPLFIRMLEYSREDAAEDMDLHDVTEKAISLGKERGILQMDDYDEIIGSAEEIDEAELTEAYVPSNIKEFAKRKGVTSLVNKVAGWAEKVGKGIRGGTAIGMNYSTLVLDMTYQGSEIRINTNNDTVTLYDEPVRSFDEFKQVYLDNQDESDNGLEEKINEALNKINEELCPAGKAYIKRRQAAGEKSSAYLSGRGVKVCKGQMSGKAKKK